jgi:hypothetical protein
MGENGSFKVSTFGAVVQPNLRQGNCGFALAVKDAVRGAAGARCNEALSV